MTDPSETGKEILVVDDEASICEFFVDLFDEYGIDIDVNNRGLQD